MKNFNICQGCGVKLQTTDINTVGYTPKADAAMCEACFKSLNYGDKANNLTEFKIEQYLERIEKDDSEVILVIDVLNPYQSMIKDINQFIDPDRLTLVVNKVDALPKAISAEAIIEYIAKIAEQRNVTFKNISLVSATKLENIDSILAYLQDLERTVSVIGYSNVGKSSFIKALFKSKMIDIKNLVSYTIGTTLEPIDQELEEQKVVDYPGFFLAGNIQNTMDKDTLRITIPKKEIKVVTHQLEEQQLINIGDQAFFALEKANEKLGYQFTFSNDFEITRRKLDKLEAKNFKEVLITPLPNVKRQDILICGLGSITFYNKGQTIKIYVPEHVSVDVVESLYN